MKFKLFFLAACILLFNGRAYAYLDPGTGSMIAQVIAASIISVGCVFCTAKEKILNFFKKFFDGNKK